MNPEYLLHLLRKLVEQLQQQKKVLATAESCTGGLLSGLLTEIPGSSQWFDRGFVTYSNESKTEMLDVPAQMIQEFGAVSNEVAEAMARGVLAKSNADIAVSITGIAGPDGGNDTKPVGTVCFGFAQRNVAEVRHERCHFIAITREKIRRMACEEAIKVLTKILQV